MSIFDVRRALLPGAVTLAVAMLGACGGGDNSTAAASSAGGATAAATTLSASSPVTTATEGDAAFNIAVSSTNPADVPIIWSTSPVASASLLSNLSNTGATYTPPAVGTLLNDQVTTITAKAPSGATTTLAITNQRKRGYLALVAGNGTSGTADGVGAAAQFTLPVGAAIDANAHVMYVTDGSAVRKVDLATNTVSTFAGSPTSTGNVDGTGTAARFKFATGIALDAAGNLYVSDMTACTIRKITPAAVVTTLAGSAGSCSAIDGSGTSALFSQPEGLAMDQAGNLYVADAGGYVRKVTPGGAVTTLGISLVPTLNMQYVAVAPAGNTLYVTANNGITRYNLSASGAVSSFVTWSGFMLPAGLAVDSTNGLLYVAEGGNRTIDRVDASGAITVVAGASGSTGFTPGPLPGVIGTPLGLARDSNGDLYVTNSARISKIVLP